MIGSSSSPTGHEPALAYPDLSSADNARIAWWLDARYGMFIHWGVASHEGIELSWARGGSKPLDISKHPAGYVEDPVYDNLYKKFNPVDFNPREWVRVAQAAGMKYMVLTAKHHDGFCLWPSDLTDYDIMSTPFKRDVVKEFVDACREAGMRVGLYYSQRDWHHPAYGIGDNKVYRDYMNGQLTELLTRYGKIDVIWFDSYGTGDLKTFWGIEETWNLLKRLQPEAVINNRLAILAAYNQQGQPYWGDFDTPEQRLGEMQTHRPWESCITLVGHQWGYKPRGEMSSVEEVIRSVVTCATGDGNLLLNVGPTPTGVIEQRQADLLGEAGAWIDRHARSIYGTRGGPYENARWGGSTRRDNSIFIHVFDWRGEETLRLLPLPQTVFSARLLNGDPIAFEQTPAGLDLTVEKSRRDPIDTVIELTLDAPAAGLIQGPALRGDHGAPTTADAGLDPMEPGSQRLSRKRLAEYRRLAYGMFLHFGMPTFEGEIPDGNAGKINPYRAVPMEAYNPTRLDVDQWIRTAADAGMRYAVLTTKHHNGFCLWPSRHTSYHVGNSPVKTDVVGKFVEACRRHGVVPGLYYASWDEYEAHRFGSKVASEVGWGNDYTTHAYRQFQLAQVEELLTGYGPIDYFFVDIPRYLGPEGRVVQYNQIARLQPQCVISFNQGFSSGDTLDTRDSWPTDICTMERRLPSHPFHPQQRYEERWMLKLPGCGEEKQPWFIPGEVCDTIGREWFFRPGDVPRSDAELVAMALICRERGTNFLLNVPPDAEGLIPEMYVEALMRLKTNLTCFPGPPA